MDWIKFGDRNIKIFHLSAVIRKNKNSIRGLLEDKGELVTDKQSLMNVIT